MKFFGLIFIGIMGVMVMPLLSQSSETAKPPLAGIAKTVDLDMGEAQEVELANGTKTRLKLMGVREYRDPLRQAARQAEAIVELNGISLTLTAATYHLPVTAGGIQIDCPVTRSYVVNSGQGNVWALKKAARFRLWPADSPWIEPDTFGYPVRQKWFASDTQMANEPTFVNGDEMPGRTNIYYHYGLDFGGAEGLTEVVSATDGLVVSAATEVLEAHKKSPAKPRYDVIYIVDGRNWYYRYSHLLTIEVKAGQRVRLGQRLGLLGKEGGSGGWAHLHFDITSRQPSGEWGIQDGYAYVWEAYRRQFSPNLVAVARPHRVVPVGQGTSLDGAKSRAAAGTISRYEWTFTDGSTATGPVAARSYPRTGTYSEILKITTDGGDEAYDFAVVQVLDPAQKRLPPAIHAAYYPTRTIRAGEPVIFKVRTFCTTQGEETWDFGDGTPPVKVKSDGNAQVHAKDGYARTEHVYAKAGCYIARVERANDLGEMAIAHLCVEVGPAFAPQTRVSIKEGRWQINGQVTYPGARAAGQLMNVRMVNSIFEDRLKPDFDSEANTDRFIAQTPDYAAHGVRAFTLCLQGGMPGYEGALNSAFNPDGSLRQQYLDRVERVIETCDRQGLAVILGCYYQRQDQVLANEHAVRAGLTNVLYWLKRRGYQNVLLEIANEYDHAGFDHRLLRMPEGQVELIRLAKQTAPDLLVSTSGLGHGRMAEAVAEVADFVLLHFNSTKVEDIPARIAAWKKHGKPVVCNEDDKTGETAARAAEVSVANGASWGLMLKEVNQYFPLTFNGAADDPIVYRKLRELTTPPGEN